MSISESEIAQQTQEKFEFYMISLVFTLLALSIQTASFGKSDFSDICELLGLALLFVSGISGVWRMEYVSVERIQKSYKTNIEDFVLVLKDPNMSRDIRQEIIDKNIKEYKAMLKELDPVIEKIEKVNMIKYRVHRLAFVFGLIFLLLSRAFIQVIYIAL